jgi:hypothetical protein
MEIGVYTCAELQPDTARGAEVAPAVRAEVARRRAA